MSWLYHCGSVRMRVLVRQICHVHSLAFLIARRCVLTLNCFAELIYRWALHVSVVVDSEYLFHGNRWKDHVLVLC